MPEEAFSKYHFSVDYQELLIACLLKHPEELGALGELVEPKLLNGIEAYEVVYHIHDYRQRYGIYPSITVLGGHLHRKMAQTSPERAEAAKAYLQKIAKRDTTHREHIKDSIKEFACHSKIYRMIQDTSTAINLGTPPEQLDLIQKVNDCMKVMQAGDDMGIHVNKDWEKILDEAGTIKGVHSGWASFRKVWPDGWGAGWLIAVLAPSKRFKTTFCVNLAINMAWEDSQADVLYYACELNQRELAERVLLSLSRMSREDLRERKERFRQTTRDKMGQLVGNVLVKSYPSKGATISTLRTHAHQAIASYGLKPRAIIIDFAETIRPDSPKGTPDHRQQAEIYTQARAMGQELGACVIMPDRANREAITAAVPNITNFQGAIEKAGIADIGIGLCQTEAEHMNGDMRYFIFVNRHGPEYLLFKGMVDPKTSYMTVGDQIHYDPNDGDSQTNGRLGGKKSYRNRPSANPDVNAAAEAERAKEEADAEAQRAHNAEEDRKKARQEQERGVKGKAKQREAERDGAVNNLKPSSY